MPWEPPVQLLPLPQGLQPPSLKKFSHSTSWVYVQLDDGDEELDGGFPSQHFNWSDGRKTGQKVSTSKQTVGLTFGRERKEKRRLCRWNKTGQFGDVNARKVLGPERRKAARPPTWGLRCKVVSSQLPKCDDHSSLHSSPMSSLVYSPQNPIYSMIPRAPS